MHASPFILTFAALFITKTIKKMMKRKFILTALAVLVCASAQARSWNVSIAKYKDNKRAAVSLTFDDGLAEHYTIVAPELEKRGFRATFGVCGALLNEDENHIKRTDRMTWPQVKDLAQRGHEIANHGWAHKNHGRFPLDTVRRDIQHNDSMIMLHTGIKPPTFFYPNNTKRPEPMKIAEEGRIGSRTFQISAGSKRTQEWFERWIDNVIDTCGWAVTMTHGITYGYDAFKQASRLTAFLDLLKQKEDSLWTGRLQDMMAYVKEREATTLDIKRRGKTISIVPTMTLDSRIFNYPLTMVVSGGGRISRIKATQDGRDLAVSLRNDGTATFDFNPNGGTIKVRVK